MQLLEIPPQTPTSEVDEEILDIFVEEVGEVLEEITNSYQAWKSDSTNLEALKTLRRCFHTLKGSGRLVGASAIGELGWRFENMLNRVIDGTLSKNNDMLSLLDQVEHVLPNMIEQFQNDQPSPYPIVLLISQADYFTQTKGQSLGEFEPPTTEEAETVSVQPPAVPSVAETISVPTQPPEQTTLAQEIEETEAEETTAAVDNLPELEEVESETITEEIEGIELEELDENLSLTETDELDWVTQEGELEELELDSLTEDNLELEADEFAATEFDLLTHCILLSNPSCFH